MSKLFNNDTIGKSPTLSGEYKKTLQAHHGSKVWGATAIKWAGPDVERILNEEHYHIETVLDYGCGQHTLAQRFPQVQWHGYDPGIPERAEKPTGTFDLVVCTDVMEHIEGEYIDAVLQEIMDYSTRVVFFEIACAPAFDKFLDGPHEGEDVHVSVHPPKWWEDKIRALKGIHVQEVHALGKQTRGTWRDRVKFILEKL